MVVFAPVLYTITSLICNIVYNDTSRLPLIMEYPYIPTEGWPYFHIMFLFEVLIMWFGINCVLGIELLTFFFVQYVCCRIDILANMIGIWNGNINRSNDDLANRKNSILLEEIVRYHSSIKRSMAKIRSIFSPMLMITLLTNSMVICMCLIIIFVVNVLLKKKRLKLLNF